MKKSSARPQLEYLEDRTVMAVANGKVAFTSNRILGAFNQPGSTNIWTMNPDGTGLQQLTGNGAIPGTNTPTSPPGYTNTEPAWSPDGTKIAFRSERDGNGEIYLMNQDGSSQTRLTNNNTIDDWPAWSPDGQHLTFTSWRDGHGEIYVMNADGTGQTRLTFGNAVNYQSAWSPDGTKILFSSYRTGEAEVWVMNADGSNQHNLTNDPINPEFTPFWSPDGTKITFGGLINGNLEILTMNANGTNQVNVTNTPGGNVDPYWSPDGTQIVFGSEREDISGQHVGRIFVMNADGTNQHDISKVSGDPGPSVSDFQVRWQPVGLPVNTTPLPPNGTPHPLPAPVFGPPNFVQVHASETVEGDTIVVTVSLSNFNLGTVQVGYTTSDTTPDRATAFGLALAHAGVDYVPQSGILTFPSGSSLSQSFTVQTINTGNFPLDKVFVSHLLLSPSGAIFTTPFGIGRITTPNRAFLTEAYRNLLKHDPIPADKANLAALLDSGAISRANVVGALLSSLEYHYDVVQDLWQKTLKHAPDFTGLAGGMNFLAAGGTAEQLKAILMGSQEYFITRGGGTVDGFLNAVYQDVLSRPIDSSRQGWSTAIANGTSNYTVALTILGSTESDVDELASLYTQYVHRSIDPNGLFGGVGFLQAGGTNESVILALVASDEYFNGHYIRTQGQ